MRRRRFLQAAGAGSLSVFASARGASAQMMRLPGTGMGGMMGRSITPSSAWPTGLPLRKLGVLANTTLAADEFEGALVASPYVASLIAGRTT